MPHFSVRFSAVLLLLFCIFSGILPAQHAVDPAARYYRVIGLVHLTGSGKLGDPIRPEYVPGPTDAVTRDGIIAWSSLPTDDGKMAIIHIVAVNHHAFDTILADARPEVKVFEIGKHEPAAIEAALQLVRAGFTLDSLKVVAQ
jgi:hypothetical protein